MKTCKKCLTQKPLGEFSQRSVERGWDNPCKRCQADAAEAHRNRDRAGHRHRQTEAYWRTRLGAIEMLGEKCVRCGFSDLRALQIDHVDGGGTREHRTIGNSAVYRKVLAGAPGYQLLCANCNWIKRSENNEHYSIASRRS